MMSNKAETAVHGMLLFLIFFASNCFIPSTTVALVRMLVTLT